MQTLWKLWCGKLLHDLFHLGDFTRGTTHRLRSSWARSSLSRGSIELARNDVAQLHDLVALVLHFLNQLLNWVHFLF